MQISKYIIPVILIALFILTFTGGPNYFSARSLREAWNLGHILLFALLIFWMQRHWLWYQKRQVISKIAIITAITLFLSVVIELIQYFFAKGIPDLGDVRRNFAGALLAFVFTQSLSRNWLRHGLKIFVLIWVLMEIIPTGRFLYDEYRAQRQFPVLADFESDLELTRWSGDHLFQRSEEKAASGHSALQITFGTTKYSGISLNHFPGDWSGYDTLRYDIFYPGTDTLEFTCRIHDRQHVRGTQRYADRFNRRFFLKPGWNAIAIPLRDVQKAPQDRTMDMKQIMAMGIFTVQLPEPRTVYLDYVRLE